MSERDDEIAGLVWPPEARNLAEAKATWERQGFTIARRMTPEELEAAFPGYTARREALKREKR